MPIPEPNQECISEWVLLWNFEDCKYCNDGEGDYYIFQCEIIENWPINGQVKTLKYTTMCVYPLQSEK
ncbi:MAG: hypothetical protein R3321_09835, partial [Nitrososphaeraceae archaeon]|nr:hypothetical protein [Nitrososphaeraceae archaeon]